MQQESREKATGIQAEVKDNSTVHVAKEMHITYESSRSPRGIPFQALALPKDYVDRPEIRQWVKSKLIDSSPSRPGTLVVSAIYGLGGVGKSVIASALAHDAEVQGVCADGVLWVTLGQNPDILSFLYGWIQALGDYDYEVL
jgi:NB-ARC domain